MTWDPRLEESKEALHRNNITNDDQTNTQTNTHDKTKHTAKTFAASSATEAEEKIAKLGKHPDGSIPVKVPKRIWRPQVQSRYEEPEDLPDMSDDLNWLFQDNGKAILADKSTLPPRNDIIE